MPASTKNVLSLIFQTDTAAAFRKVTCAQSGDKCAFLETIMHDNMNLQVHEYMYATLISICIVDAADSCMYCVYMCGWVYNKCVSASLSFLCVWGVRTVIVYVLISELHEYVVGWFRLVTPLEVRRHADKAICSLFCWIVTLSTGTQGAWAHPDPSHTSICNLPTKMADNCPVLCVCVCVCVGALLRQTSFSFFFFIKLVWDRGSARQNSSWKDNSRHRK